MAAMRRAKVVLAMLPILSVLIASPFFHSHFGQAGDPILFPEEPVVAVHHAHFPEERGASAGEGGRHSGLDHSSKDTKPFVLLADASATAFRDLGSSIAARPTPVHLSLVLVERLSSVVRVAIHDPPGRGLPTLRAPPPPHSI
jgi:hypothetical protein